MKRYLRICFIALTLGITLCLAGCFGCGGCFGASCGADGCFGGEPSEDSEITLHFMAGEKELSSLQVARSGEFAFPADPTKQGYRFDGWYTDAALTTPLFTPDLSRIAGIDLKTVEEISLYARFTPIVYTVTYEDVNGAVNSNPTTYTIEDGTIPLLPLSLEGKRFDGWMTTNDRIVDEIAAVFDENITLRALWNAFDLTDITYDETATAIRASDTLTAELFGIACTDMLGNGAEIRVAANTSQAPGNIMNVTVTASNDLFTKTLVIENVKVYGAPHITYLGESGVIKEEDDPYTMFEATDSFGVPLTPVITVSGTLSETEALRVTVSATDVLGNTLETVFRLSLPQAPFTFYDATDHYTVTGYTGTSPHVIIPASYRGKPVIGIGDNAFKERNDITSVVIPEGVKYINRGAFQNCLGLITVSIPDTVILISEYAFHGCERLIEVKNDSVLNIAIGGSSNGGIGLYVKNVYSSDSGSSYLSTTADGFHVYAKGDKRYLMGYSGGESAITLPAELAGGAYTIYPYAFSSGSATSITLPSGITAIDKHTFLGCTSLVEVVLPDTLTSIGREAFSGCTSLSTLRIPASVTAILKDTFSGCTSLIETIGTEQYADKWLISSTASGTLTVRPGTIGIADEAVYNRTQLTALSLPDSIRYIGNSAFKNCRGITELRLPEGVLSVGSSAFENCSNITAVYFPTSFTSAGLDAFSGCPGLRAVHITDLAPWFEITFSGMNANPLYYADHLYLNGTLLSRLVIPEGVTQIKANAFHGYTGLISVQLPASIESIDTGAFLGCTHLVEICNNSALEIVKDKYAHGEIARYAEYIYSSETGTSRISITSDNYVFYSAPEVQYLIYYLGNATALTLPNGFGGRAYTIHQNAFRGNQKLTSISLPALLTPLETDTFLGCTGLIETVDNVNYVDTWAIGVSASTAIVNLREGTVGIAVDAFRGNTDITTLTLPSSLTSVGAHAFDGCTSLTTATLLSGITRIDEYAFNGCTSLSAVSLPSSLTAIGSYAFTATAIAEVSIPGGVSVIRAHTFENCRSLVTVTIETGVSHIEGSAFSQCTNLESVSLPDSLVRMESLAFSNCNKVIETQYGIQYIGKWVIGVTDPSDRIRNDTIGIADKAYYNQSIHNVTVPASVRYIGAYAFANCSYLYTVTLSEGLLTIGDYAFCKCGNIEDISIPSTMTSIGEKAFGECHNIPTLTLPKSLTHIGHTAFYDCAALTTLTVHADNPVYHSVNNCLIETATGTLLAGCNTSIIPTDGSITAIGDRAFYRCEGITTLTIPAGVTSIGDEAFCHCINITSVTIPESVNTIGSSAFYACYKLTSVTIPESVNTIGDSAFYACYKLIEVCNLSSLPIAVGSADCGSAGYYAKNVYSPASGASKLTTDANGYLFYTDNDTVLLVAYTGTDTVLTLPNDYGGKAYAIYDYAFYKLQGMTAITIPKSVTAIGATAFEACEALTSITYTGTIAEWRALEKGYLWDYNTGAYTITCIDGRLNQIGNVIS